MSWGRSPGADGQAPHDPGLTAGQERDATTGRAKRARRSAQGGMAAALSAPWTRCDLPSSSTSCWTCGRAPRTACATGRAAQVVHVKHLAVLRDQTMGYEPARPSVILAELGFVAEARGGAPGRPGPPRPPNRATWNPRAAALALEGLAGAKQSAEPARLSTITQCGAAARQLGLPAASAFAALAAAASLAAQLRPVRGMPWPSTRISSSRPRRSRGQGTPRFGPCVQSLHKRAGQAPCNPSIRD